MKSLPIPRRLLLRSPLLAIAAALWAASPAKAQVLDLDAQLTALAQLLSNTAPSAPDADRIDTLNDLANQLIGSGGVLSDINVELDRQTGVLTTQAGELLSLRTDLLDLRGRVGSGTDLTDIRSAMLLMAQDVQAAEADIDRHEVAMAVMEAEGDGLRRDVDRHEQAIATLATAARRETAMLTNHETRLDRHEQAISDLSGRVETANEGVAMALAMRTPPLGEGKTFAVSGGWGTFEGKNAFAVAGAVRAADNIQLDGGVALGSEGSSVGGRAGATISW